jgi:hypothetical protein
MIYAAMVSRRFFVPRGNQMTYGRTTGPQTSHVTGRR